MDPFVIRFLKASLAWLAIGVTVGIAMAVSPALAVYRTAHFHILLLGFITMMIAGVAYHVIPRFAATHLAMPKLVGAHFFAANLGLVLMVSGFVTRVHALAIGTVLLAAGGFLTALGAYSMAWNLWRTLGRAAPRPSKLPPIRPLRITVADPVAVP